MPPATPARPPAMVAIDGTRLRTLRQDRGLTQVALAERAELAAPYLSQLETGVRSRVSPGAYLRLAKALRVRPAALRSQPGQTMPDVA